MSGVMDCNKSIILPPEVLQEIEEALNAPLFFGMPVGATMTDALSVALYTGNRVWNWRARITDFLRYYYQRFHQPLFSLRDFSQYEGRIVFTWQFDRQDLKAFVLPLVENYGHDNSVIVGPLASMQAQLPNRTNFILLGEFPKIDMRIWRREFDRCLPIWRHRLNQVLARHLVPKFVAIFLLRRLQIQTQRIMAASQFLEVVRPRIIVTECDRSGLASCLVLAARHRNIPAVTMVHGVLEPYPAYGFVPILADYVCCWGDQHRHNLMEHGVNAEHLIVTGCHAISQTLDVSVDAARLKVGLAVNKPVVLFATQPFKLEDKKRNARVFCVAMTKLIDVTAVVRLHPAENIGEYQELIDEFPNVMFLSNEVMSRDESLAASDIVVNYESSFGVDALLKGKLVIILDVLSAPLKIGKELVEMAGCPSVKGSDELALVIRNILTNENLRNQLQAKAEQYCRAYCDSYGQDALKNVSRVIDHAIERGEH